MVEHISHRVAVMYLGKIVELADKRRSSAIRCTPTPRRCSSAVPVPTRQRRSKRIILTGDVPSPITPPPGCRFHTRCPYAEERCRRVEPSIQEVRPGHAVACHLREVKPQ